MDDLDREVHAAAVGRWVAAYEQAWRAPGVAALGELFTDDARYRHAPYETWIVGLPEIERDWEAERDGPDEIFSMTSSVVAVDPPVAVVRTEVRYGQPVAQEYRNLWVIDFAPDGRCRSFEEWPFRPTADGTGGLPADRDA